MTMRFYLCITVVLLGWDCFAQKGVIVLYRKNENKDKKYTVRLKIGSLKADTIPPSNGIVYLTNDLTQIAIYSWIENAPSWPEAMLKLNLVENDTTFIELGFKKDGVGNPSPKLTVVTAGFAKDALSTGIAFRKLEGEDNIITFSTEINRKRTGTGFLVSSQGYVVTNYHVIEKANSIKIRNVNGDKLSVFNATVLLMDEKVDLAVLKLEGSIPLLDSIPYSIKSETVDLGEKIELYGYPLTNSMGNDIKLTNGIVSSINGFQGDTLAYQLSAPVQPGNSGGPVFDEKGNLVAVVNAKHLQAENVTYAIKATQLIAFLKRVSNYAPAKSSVELWRLSIVEQAKILQKSVYIIEVN